MSVIKPTNSPKLTDTFIWHLNSFVDMEMCTELYSKALQGDYERGQIDGQRILLFSILSHSS